MQLQLTENVRINAGEELGRAPIAKGSDTDELIAPIDPDYERAARVALTSVNAAVGVDSRAHHVLRDSAGVRIAPVADVSTDDAHAGLIQHGDFDFAQYKSAFRIKACVTLLPSSSQSADFLRTSECPILI